MQKVPASYLPPDPSTLPSPPHLPFPALLRWDEALAGYWPACDYDAKGKREQRRTGQGFQITLWTLTSLISDRQRVDKVPVGVSWVRVAEVVSNCRHARESTR